MARWNAALHPRDFRGRFSGRGGGPAARAQRRAGNKTAPGMRGKRARGYTVGGYQIASGVAGGAFTSAVGRRAGSRAHMAGGAAFAGGHIAQGTHRIRSTRRQTSRAFAALNADEQEQEIARGRKIDRRYAIGNALSGVAAGQANSRAVQREFTARSKDHEWEVRKARKSDTRVRGKYTKYQGPASHRGKPRNRRGVYDITSSPVRKPRTAGGRRAAGYSNAFKRRTGSKRKRAPRQRNLALPASPRTSKRRRGRKR